jgi:hypothetical protein
MRCTRERENSFSWEHILYLCVLCVAYEMSGRARSLLEEESVVYWYSI